MKVQRMNCTRTAIATLCLMLGLMISVSADAQGGGARSSTRLWYQQPAAKWEEASPVGNGRLGAMAFGGTAEERVQLNESTLWGGSPCDYSNPGAGQHLSELRKLILAGKPAEAQGLADRMLGNPRCQKPYQPLGALRLRFPRHEHVENYERALHLDLATTTPGSSRKPERSAF